MARQPASYDDPDFRNHERAVGRRRIVAAALIVLALTGLAGGSAAAAVVSAHDERVGPSPSSVVVDDA